MINLSGGEFQIIYVLNLIFAIYNLEFHRDIGQ